MGIPTGYNSWALVSYEITREAHHYLLPALPRWRLYERAARFFYLGTPIEHKSDLLPRLRYLD